MSWWPCFSKQIQTVFSDTRFQAAVLMTMLQQAYPHYVFWRCRFQAAQANHELRCPDDHASASKSRPCFLTLVFKHWSWWACFSKQIQSVFSDTVFWRSRFQAAQANHEARRPDDHASAECHHPAPLGQQAWGKVSVLLDGLVSGLVIATKLA